MASIKGQAEWDKFKKGKFLTRRQAMLAMCFECNGDKEDATEDCLGNNCPIYQYHHYRGKRRGENILLGKQGDEEWERETGISLKNRWKR